MYNIYTYVVYCYTKAYGDQGLNVHMEKKDAAADFSQRSRPVIEFVSLSTPLSLCAAVWKQSCLAIDDLILQWNFEGVTSFPLPLSSWDLQGVFI